MQQPADVVVRPATRHVPRSVVRDAHERIVRCGLGIVPVSSDTEDKFEDAMEVTASSPLPEIARVLLRFDQVASRMRSVAKLEGIVATAETQQSHPFKGQSPLTFCHSLVSCGATSLLRENYCDRDYQWPRQTPTFFVRL